MSAQEPEYVRRRKERAEQEEVRDGAERDARKRQQDRSALASLIKDIRRERGAQNESERKKFPIEATAAVAAVIAAAVTIGNLIWFVSISEKTDRTANRAIAISQKQLAQMQFQERPWIKIDVAPTGPFTFDKKSGDAMMMFKITLTNVGHSVAEAVYMEPQMTPNNGFPDIYDRVQQACALRGWLESLATKSPRKEFGHDVIFPNDNIVVPSMGVPLTKKQLAQPGWAGGAWTQGSQKLMFPILFGCISYREHGSKRVFLTGFDFEFGKGGSGIVVGTDVPPGQLQIIPFHSPMPYIQ